jgi:hypothetical protein
MTNAEKIDHAMSVLRAENTEVARQRNPQAVEQRRTYYEKTTDRERGDSSSWAGSSMAGGTWAGRSR